MGLDSIEIVLRTKAFFNIAISDGEAAQVRTFQVNLLEKDTRSTTARPKTVAGSHFCKD